MRILVTDLDGTLLGGGDADRHRLRAALRRHPEVTVVFATGRGLPSVREVLADPLVPGPRWIIADVGASVLDGTDLTPVEDVQRRLRAGWPGADRVRAALRRFPALTYQEDAVQDGRCSFLVPPDLLSRDIKDAVEALGCSWHYSAGCFLDVLPGGASKGRALVALAAREGWPMSSVLVAGDSLNDLSLYGVGAHGVIVGGAEPGLSAAVPEDGRVYRARRPGAGGVLAALRNLGWVADEAPLVVAYHRPPVRRTARGWRAPSGPNGILPTLTSLFAGPEGAAGEGARWVTAAVVDEDAAPGDLDTHGTGLPLSFVPVGAREWAGYVHRACKRALWPVLMREPGRMRFDPADWAHYRAVNARFADHIGATAAPGGTVWLHDYNLWLVPGLLRDARPDLRVGLFHHTPFPSPEEFAALPPAPRIRESLARLDWAGFHTADHADRFRRVMGGPGHAPRTGVHPLGVDRAAIEALVRGLPGPAREKGGGGGGPLVLSVERLDYVKAPVAKVDAVAALLSRRPDLRGRLRFRLVCPPPENGITVHDETLRLLERRIREVNDTWGAGGRPPVEYVPEPLAFPEVVEEYLAADVFWVTALQDGMNLTAKEFAAAHAAAGLSGVLVLSRYAGAAAELGGPALLTDPRSPEDLVATLERALALPPDERRARMARLDRCLGRGTPARWAAEVVAAIEAAAGDRAAALPAPPPSETRMVTESTRRATRSVTF